VSCRITVRPAHPGIVSPSSRLPPWLHKGSLARSACRCVGGIAAAPPALHSSAQHRQRCCGLSAALQARKHLLQNRFAAGSGSGAGHESPDRGLRRSPSGPAPGARLPAPRSFVGDHMTASDRIVQLPRGDLAAGGQPRACSPARLGPQPMGPARRARVWRRHPPTSGRWRVCSYSLAGIPPLHQPPDDAPPSRHDL
jgi:hypothetical protein